MIPGKEVDEVLKILGKTSIFEGLSPESLRDISNKIQLKHIGKDFPVIKEGQSGVNLYLIKSGSSRVVIEAKETSDDEFTVAIIRKGDCFGEMSLLTGEPCCATVKTNEDSCFYVLTKNDFDDIISKNSIVYKHISKLLINRLSEQNIQNIHIKEHEIALNRYLQKTKEYQFSNIIGKSKSISDFLNEAGAFSETDTPVTIIGEHGTGKELIARKIHEDSTRSKFPVIEITLSNERRMMETAIHNERRKRDQVECELFGIDKIEISIESEKRIGLLELVDKGTLIIKNVENMSLHIQKEFLDFMETGSFSKIGGIKQLQSKIKIIVTCTNFNLMEEKLDERLFDLFTTQKLEILPLRNRKRDIPILIEHFISKTCKVKHIHTKKLSKEAINKLLQYDYPGNVGELEKTIVRAVELSGENDFIEEEEIFFEDIKIDGEKKLDLLSFALFKRLCLSPKIIFTAKLIALILLFTSFYFTIVQPDVLLNGRNIALIICWNFWLPLLYVTFLFASRIGCGICPIFSISKFLNKFVSLKLPFPSFLKKHDVWTMGVGFIIIIIIESYTHMAFSSTYTAFLLFAILFGAIVIDFIFEKHAWCRHLCPVGGLSKLYAMSSITEIRSNKNLCTTMCNTYDCYKGTTKAERCPAFLHLPSMSNNKECKFCLNCIKNCSHNSIQVNLRIPGVEIASLRNTSLAEASLSILLGGLLVAEILSKLNISRPDVLPIFTFSLFSVLTMCFACCYFTASITDGAMIEHAKLFGYTLLPLTLFGHIALNLMEVFENMNGSLILLSIYKINVNFTYIVQSFLTITGFLITEYLIYKIIKEKFEKDKQYRIFTIQATVPLILCIVYIVLFCKVNSIL